MNWSSSLEMPLSLINFQIEDMTFSQKENIARILFEPKLDIHYDVNSYWLLDLTSKISNSFGNIHQMYNGYVLTSYRNMQRTTTHLLQAVNYDNTIGVNYRNPVQTMFFGVRYSYNIKKNNIMFVSNIDTNGLTIQNALQKDNFNEFQGLNTTFNKYFRNMKTTVWISNFIFKQSSQQVINQNLTQVVAQGISASIRALWNVKNNINIDYSYQISANRTIAYAQSNKSILIQQHSVKADIVPLHNWLLRIKNEIYINDYSTHRNFFLDLTIRKTVEKQKLDFELSWTNIFDNQGFLEKG